MAKYEASKLIEVNGVCLHYVVEGEGKPVVLVHGNGESHEIFDVLIGQLVDAGYKVYAPDSRGHGLNEPLDEYHYADMAEDMFQFIKHLGLEKPAFYGFSDGGIIGLMMEIVHPGTVGVMSVSGTNLSPKGLTRDFIDEYTEIYKKEPNPLLRLMLEEPDINPCDLEKISVPVLVTAGENDLILRQETVCISDHLPKAELAIVKGADHGSYIIGSKIIGNYLVEFLTAYY